ncbi:MAG: FG-GAP repeat protein [Planctomycetota bacterium]
MTARTLAASLAALGVASAPALAQCHLAKLVPDDFAVNQDFGYAVAVDGATALVGSNLDSTVAENGGAVYVYESTPDGWVPSAKLFASDASATLLFGQAVALDGDRAVIGASAAGNAGAAYVFERFGPLWVEVAKLELENPATADDFGRSVAIDGDRILIGARGEDTAGSEAGAAFLYEPDGSGWSLVAELRATPPLPLETLGYSVDLDGDVAVLGGPFSNQPETPLGGVVYVFERTEATWTQTARLQPADLAPVDQFGWAVAVSGDTIAACSLNAQVGGTASGATYFFERAGGSWVEDQKLTVKGPAFGGIGYDVALDGDRLVASAPNGFGAQGLVYVFEREPSGWQEAYKLLAPAGSSADQYGWSVGLAGGTVVVGDPRDDLEDIADVGAAHIHVVGGAEYVSITPRTTTISAQTGGIQLLDLSTCPPQSGDLWFLLGSTSGTSPGVPLGDGLVIPLVADDYFAYTLAYPNSIPLVFSLDFMPAGGITTAQVSIPFGFPELAGVEAHHAFVLIDPATLAPKLVSNPAPLSIVP